MREILFRGKRLDNGEWVEGYVWQGNGSKNGVKSESWFIGDDWDDVEVDPETVGQFTGMHDKNGVRIFEGDIASHDAGFGHVVKGIIRFGVAPTDFAGNVGHVGFYVEWQDDGANMWSEWWRNDLSYWADKIKVIGNIHDKEATP